MFKVDTPSKDLFGYTSVIVKTPSGVFEARTTINGATFTGTAPNPSAASQKLSEVVADAQVRGNIPVASTRPQTPSVPIERVARG